jgi:23S rRNA (cytosine1962-C5)-methyltransferase
LGERVKKGDRVLDAFCYTGGFSMYAARSGATTLGIDIHPESVGLAKRIAELNGLDCAYEQANVFDWLEREPGELFDWIILDPPAIAKTGAARDSLKWAIWKLAHRAIPHMKPGARMIACSCSYQIDRKELVETIRLAASDRGVRMFLEDVTFQDLDHPMPIQFPESLYLKCAWLRLG